MSFQNAFIGQRTKPNDRQVAAALGKRKALWDALLASVAHDSPIDGQEWSSYSPKAGWSLRLKSGERNVVYLAPGADCFQASFALGDKALAAARESGLPQSVLKLIAGAKRYAEGTAVRIEVHGAADIAVVKKLMAAKLGK